MANKYVDIQVLTYAVQSLAQSITNTFAMRKMAVSALEIIKDIPTGSTSTDTEWCIKVTYADDATATPHFVLLGLKQIFSDIDLSKYYTKDEIDTTLADYYLKTEIDTILNDYYLKTEIDTILLDYYDKTEVDTKLGDYYTKTETDTKLGDYYKKTETYSKTEVDGLIPDVSNFITDGDVNTKLTDYYKKTEVDGLIPDVSNFVTDTDVNNKLTNYYDKTTIDGMIPDVSTYYTKTEVDGLIPDVSNFVTDSDVDTKLGNYYDKTTVDGMIPDTSSFITDSDVNTKLTDYYKKTEVDGLIPDVSNFVTDSDVNTKLGDYYKKTETYNKIELDQKLVDITPDMTDYYTKTEIDTTFTNYYDKPEIDTKFADYYKKTETYSKTETDGFLDKKAQQSDVDVLSSKVAQIFSSMVDNTTLDSIIQDVKTEVANKLEDSDLNVIRSDITILQNRAKNLEDGKLDKKDLPKKVSAFENDAKYQTDLEVSSAVSTSATKTLDDAKKYVNERISDINTLDPNDFYNKNQVDNKFHDYYLKTETYNKTEIDGKLDTKAGLDTATDTADGLLSHELYSIIKEIDPDAMGKNGADGLTPECEITTVGNVHTITFITGDQSKSFQLIDGKDGTNGKDGKNGTNGTNGTNGISVTSAKINTKNHLIMYLSNGTTVDCGNIDSEALDIHKIEIVNDQLTVTMSDGSVKKLGNVKGATGKGIDKMVLDETTHEIMVYYDDGTVNNAGLIQGVKGDKGDKGDSGTGLTHLDITDGENIIATYADGSTQNLGTITGAKGDKGDPGKNGTSISAVSADKNNNLIVTLSDGQKFNLGNYVGPTGRGIKSVGVNGDYELILTMTDGTVINTGKLEVNVKDIFVTDAKLNDEGELIFTFSDGSTQNNGRINGAEGFSIREYAKLTNGQTIHAGCMMLWENMIYKVDKDFTCTTNFNVDKANMSKITTDATLIDLYNASIASLPSTATPPTFDEWMHEWMEQKFDNPIVSYATVVNRTSFSANAVYNLTYKDCIGGTTFNGDLITLPDDGAYMLMLETPYYGSSTATGYRYSYIYDLQQNKYIYDECIHSYTGTIEYRFAYPSMKCILTGCAGDMFQIKVKNRTATNYGGAPENKIYLYKLTTPNHVVNIHDLYKVYLDSTADTDPMSEEEWIKSIYNRDSFRMEGVFNQSYTDATDVLLTGFSFSNGNEDMMCDDFGRFTALYSGLYYVRLQLRLETTNNYPSRFYLIKNGKYGESGYSTKVIAQSTEGYQTNSAFLQSLNAVFWLTKGDYFTIGFQSSVQDTNTLKSISNGFEYGLLGGGSGSSGGGGSSDSGASTGAGIQLYDTLGIGSLVRENAVVQYQRRLYRVVENFFCTNVFVNDRVHMIQFYGSGHGIIDYDDTRLDHTEEFLPGEFILKRVKREITDIDGEHYTADVDDIYEVVSAFKWSGNFDYDKVNLVKILGSFDDYDQVIKRLEGQIDAINQTNKDLEDIIDDLGLILDDINRTVV